MTKINQTLIEDLQFFLETKQNVLVTFRTKTNKIRVMDCTRRLDFVPENQQEGINDFRINGPAIIGVYDWQNSAWRSFRKDSVISFVVQNENQ